MPIKNLINAIADRIRGCKHELFKIKIWILINIFRRKYQLSCDTADDLCSDYSVWTFWEIKRDGTKKLIRTDVFK
jgi:hypothetical protein